VREENRRRIGRGRVRGALEISGFSKAKGLRIIAILAA
jgi:hypothetical protein